MITTPITDYIFHVHTRRCRHAEDISDEAYIQYAIEKKADSIWFSDHAPFPGDPFGNRMPYSELGEYVSSLDELRKRYQGAIDVHVGLEIEYFPSFAHSGYYDYLKSYNGIDFLLLGQHMAETNKGEYTFSWSDEQKKNDEHKALAGAETEGADSRYFDVLAHPDRIFKRLDRWNNETDSLSDEIISACLRNNVILEQNVSSIRQNGHYQPEFWKKVPDTASVILGSDAHHVKDMYMPEDLSEDLLKLSGDTLDRFAPSGMIKYMRSMTDLSQKNFADYFRIPVSTVKDWEQGRRKPAYYTIRMMHKILSVNKHMYLK